MWKQMSDMLYAYIIESEMLLMRFYGVNPFEVMKDIPLLDLQIYVKKIQDIEKKEQESIKKNDIMKALAQICDILNLMFYKKHRNK